MTRTPLDPTQPPVLGAHHSAYRCRDAEETRAFYEDVLGLPLVQALEIKEHPTTGEALSYMHVFFDIGGAIDSAPNYIAFFEVVDEAGTVPLFDFKKQWGMDLHFAMGVSDRDALAVWQQRLADRGVDVEGPIDHGFITSIYFHDPNGYRLEFTTQDATEAALFEENRKQAHANMKRWAAATAARQQAAE
jgi:catechol 2,3-dioxygenase-like lactoylglutathione lyase family enzyme